MIQFDGSGCVTFRLTAPHAGSVALVGCFDGWHEQRIAMTPSAEGVWTTSIRVGAGEHLFRYLVDGRQWVIDMDAHGVVRSAAGEIVSRCWCPPISMDPDALAA